MLSCCAAQDAENNWQFDVFAFADACPGQTLSMLGYHFYKRAGLITHYHMDEVKLCNYLKAIEAGYNSDNPYHNRYFNTGIDAVYLHFSFPLLLCKFAAPSINEP